MNLHLKNMFSFSGTKVALILAFLIAPCLGAWAIEREEASKQIDASLEKWNAIKEKCGGNYSYKVHWENKLGFGHDSIIVVKDNQVAERKFTQWKLDNGAQKQTDNWTEQGEKLGTHKKGAKPQTLDEIYASAKKMLAKPQKEFWKLEVNFDKQGLLLRCRYIDSRHKEDPPSSGVDITSIQLPESK